MNDWFKIEVYCPTTTADLEGTKELSETEIITLKNEGVFLDDLKEFAFINLEIEIIAQLNPKAFVPNGGTNRRWATEIVFDSGRIMYAVGKPDAVWQKVSDYLKGQG